MMLRDHHRIVPIVLYWSTLATAHVTGACLASSRSRAFSVIGDVGTLRSRCAWYAHIAWFPDPSIAGASRHSDSSNAKANEGGVE